ncbi:MAG: hypothetical protein ACKPE1_05125, partial [Dolichospermum sp.]
MKTVLLKLFSLFNRQYFLVSSITHLININTCVIKVTLPDNDLYILCENTNLHQTLLDSLQIEENNDHQCSLKKVLIYARKLDEDLPKWCYYLYLNQIYQYLEQLVTETLTISNSSPLILNESLSNLNLTPLEAILKPWDNCKNVSAITRILKTSTIQVMLIPTAELLHKICNRPICPPLYQMSKKFTQFMIRELQISVILGLSIHGGQTANKELVWFHKLNIIEDLRLVLTQKFATKSKYRDSQITIQTPAPIAPIKYPNSRDEEVQNLDKKITKDWTANINNQIKKLLLNSKLFTTFNHNINQNPKHQPIGSFALCLGLGLLLVLESDLILSCILPQVNKSNNIIPPLSSLSQPSAPEKNNQTKQISTQLNHEQHTFNASGLINDHHNNSPVLPLQENTNAITILLAAKPQMPSFNARQLDEQLALYKQRLAIKKRPPDVLIVGSSRALRGVDPLALSRALVSQGYSNLDIFNFGINGATAQVVDCLIRQILEPQELPKMILWADGSRAFNNGREDITFNAIAVSQAYKQILQKTRTTVNNNTINKNKEGSLNKMITKSTTKDINIYQAADNWLNQSLSSFSASYKNRQQIKTILQKKLQNLPFIYQHSQMKTNVNLTSYSTI